MGQTITNFLNGLLSNSMNIDIVTRIDIYTHSFQLGPNQGIHITAKAIIITARNSRHIRSRSFPKTFLKNKNHIHSIKPRVGSYNKAPNLIVHMVCPSFAHHGCTVELIFTPTLIFPLRAPNLVPMAWYIWP